MKSLADGHEKVIVCTTPPVVPSGPTLAELNAGIDASIGILASDWAFGPTDSETFSEPAVGDVDISTAYGRSNGNFAMTIFRSFLATGLVDPATDTLFSALKVKSTRVWVYSRRNGKLSTAALAAGEELRYGAEVLIDTPQDPGAGGYIKYKVPGQIQRAWPFITIAGT